MMSRRKVILIGFVISLLVPIIHFITLKARIARLNSADGSRSNMTEGMSNIGIVQPDAGSHVHIAYWYLYTMIDFLRDFLVSMLVYILLVYAIRAFRLRLAKR